MPPGSPPSTCSTLLEDRGVDVQGTNTAGGAPDGTTEIAGIDSPPMSAIVNTMLTESDNTLSELFLKEMAVHEGQPGTHRRRPRGVPPDRRRAGASPPRGSCLADGSGLHDENRHHLRVPHPGARRAGPGVVDRRRPAPSRPRAAPSSSAWRGPPPGASGPRPARCTSRPPCRATPAPSPGYDLTFTYIANDDEVSEDLLDVQELFAAVLVQYPEGPTPAEVAPLPTAE